MVAFGRHVILHSAARSVARAVLRFAPFSAIAGTMPISARFVVASATVLLTVGFAALIGIIATTLWLGERVQVHSRDVTAARETRTLAVELRSSLQTAESSQRGFLLSGNEIYLAPYDRAKTIVLQNLEALQGALDGYQLAPPLYSRLAQVVKAKIADMDQSIALKNVGRGDDALGMFRTNRGKALMDEANVFLSGIIRASDDKLTASLAEQQANASWLRWSSTLGAVLIAAVVAGVVITLGRYAKEIAAARDEVRAVNAGLESRVQERTADLARSRDRAETLLAEVNHRVANSLSLVASMVKLQARTVDVDAAKAALAETEARINAVASVHRSLYTSGNVQSVALDEYLAGLMDGLADVMRSEGLHSQLRYDLEPLTLPTDASVNLGVVATEWVTNAFKYAYPGTGGEVYVSLKRLPDDRGELVVADSGVGMSHKEKPRGTGLGTRIVRAMAQSVRGEIDYRDGSPGTSARIVFPLAA